MVWNVRPLGYRLLATDQLRCLHCVLTYGDEGDLEPIAFTDVAAQQLRCGYCKQRLTLYYEQIEAADGGAYDFELDLEPGYLGYPNYQSFLFTQLLRERDDIEQLLHHTNVAMSCSRRD